MKRLIYIALILLFPILSFSQSVTKETVKLNLDKDDLFLVKQYLESNSFEFTQTDTSLNFYLNSKYYTESGYQVYSKNSFYISNYGYILTLNYINKDVLFDEKNINRFIDDLMEFISVKKKHYENNEISNSKLSNSYANLTIQLKDFSLKQSKGNKLDISSYAIFILGHGAITTPLLLKNKPKLAIASGVLISAISLNLKLSSIAIKLKSSKNLNKSL